MTQRRNFAHRVAMVHWSMDVCSARKHIQGERLVQLYLRDRQRAIISKALGAQSFDLKRVAWRAWQRRQTVRHKIPNVQGNHSLTITHGVADLRST